MGPRRVIAGGDEDHHGDYGDGGRRHEKMRGLSAVTLSLDSTPGRGHVHPE